VENVEDGLGELEVAGLWREEHDEVVYIQGGAEWDGSDPEKVKE
jgi:hypothetical protein